MPKDPCCQQKSLLLFAGETWQLWHQEGTVVTNAPGPRCLKHSTDSVIAPRPRLASHGRAAPRHSGTRFLSSWLQEAQLPLHAAARALKGPPGPAAAAFLGHLTGRTLSTPDLTSRGLTAPQQMTANPRPSQLLVSPRT